MEVTSHVLHMDYNTHTPGHPRTADEAWYSYPVH